VKILQTRGFAYEPNPTPLAGLQGRRVHHPDIRIE
jgi:hypothetical protein